MRGEHLVMPPASQESSADAMEGTVTVMPRHAARRVRREARDASESQDPAPVPHEGAATDQEDSDVSVLTMPCGSRGYLSGQDSAQAPLRALMKLTPPFIDSLVHHWAVRQCWRGQPCSPPLRPKEAEKWEITALEELGLMASGQVTG